MTLGSIFSKLSGIKLRSIAKWYGIVVMSVVLLVIFLFKPAFAQEDATAPVVLDLKFEPRVVDTARSDQTITVTARITDNLSGMKQAQVSIKHNTGSGWFAIFFVPEDRIQGDALDGIYQTIFVLKRYSPYGEWVIELVATLDEVNNYMIFIPASSPGISNPHQLLDPSNETNFVNGHWSEIFLPEVVKS